MISRFIICGIVWLLSLATSTAMTVSVQPADTEAILRKCGDKWLAARWIATTGAANDKAPACCKDDPTRAMVISSEAELGEFQKLYKKVFEAFAGKGTEHKELPAVRQVTWGNIPAGRKSTRV